MSHSLDRVSAETPPISLAQLHLCFEYRGALNAIRTTRLCLINDITRYEATLNKYRHIPVRDVIRTHLNIYHSIKYARIRVFTDPYSPVYLGTKG